MTDHLEGEAQRILALAAIRLTQARARAAIARMLLDQMSHHFIALSRDDARDFARSVWTEFQGTDGRAEDMPLELQAGVFAKVALWLDEADIIRLAREAWGDQDVEATHGLDHVVWMPADEVVIITAGHVHADGSTGQVDLVVSPMRMSGWQR